MGVPPVRPVGNPPPSHQVAIQTFSGAAASIPSAGCLPPAGILSARPTMKPPAVPDGVAESASPPSNVDRRAANDP